MTLSYMSTNFCKPQHTCEMRDHTDSYLVGLLIETNDLKHINCLHYLAHHKFTLSVFIFSFHLLKTLTSMTMLPFCLNSLILQILENLHPRF